MVFGVNYNAFVLWLSIGGRIPASGLMFQFALYEARRNRMERVLCGAFRNMGNFRIYLGPIGDCNRSHFLDEVGVSPLKNDRIRLALFSDLRCWDLLCTSDVSLST